MADPSAPGSHRTRRFSWGTRLLAPLALIAVAFVVFLLVSSFLGGDDGMSEPASPTTATTPEKAKKSEASGGEDAPKTYAVQSGDSLSTIAEQFGLSVEKLQALNPDADPDALIEGEELKLR